MNTQQLIDENNRLLAEIATLKEELRTQRINSNADHLDDLRDMRREAITDAEEAAYQCGGGGDWLEQ